MVVVVHFQVSWTVAYTVDNFPIVLLFDTKQYADTANLWNHLVLIFSLSPYLNYFVNFNMYMQWCLEKSTCHLFCFGYFVFGITTI